MVKRSTNRLAVKTIKRSVRVKFKTKSGKTVFFKAVKTFEKKG
jgi:hypothetical protein